MNVRTAQHLLLIASMFYEVVISCVDICYHYKRLIIKTTLITIITTKHPPDGNCSYEVRSASFDLAWEISSSLISLNLPVFATPPVTLAATTSLTYPSAPDSAL